MENSNNIQDYERLNRILNRVPNKGEFIDELESYVDDINNENELESVNSRLKHYVSYFFPILLIFPSSINTSVSSKIPSSSIVQTVAFLIKIVSC